MSKPAPPHNRLIVREANAALKRLGLIQSGRSRSWRDDHGDSVTLVEFQSHSYKQGTFLNVGVCWLWRPQEYYTFDFGHRIGDFTPFDDEDSFVAALRLKIAEAIDAVQRCRAMLASPAATADALAGVPLLERSEHKLYNAAIAGALAGRWDAARELAAKIQACAHGPPKFRDPVLALHALAQSLLEDPEQLRSKLDAIVAQSRAALKLPPSGA